MFNVSLTAMPGRVAITLCMALAACGLPGRSSETVSRGLPRIKADAPLFTGAREVTVTFDTLWLREDYTRFQSPRVQAEFIYASAQPQGEAVLQTGLGFDQAADSWNLNRTDTRSTGTIYRREEDGRAVFYQPYRLTGRGWGCVALQSSWAPVARDRRARPSNLVFGYVCDRTRAVMTPEQALRIVRDLSFTTGTVASPRPPALIADTGPEALIAVAQGGAGDGSTGNRAFPLRIARPVEPPTSGSVSVGVVGGFGNFGYYGGPYGYYRYPYGYYPYHSGDRRDRGDDLGPGDDTAGNIGGGGPGRDPGPVDPGVRLSVDEAGTYVVPNVSVDEAGTYPAPNFSVDEAGSYPLSAPGTGAVGVGSGGG